MTATKSYCVLLIILLCVSWVDSRSPGEDVPDLPCPNAQDILPCPNAQDILPCPNAQDILPCPNAQDILPCPNAQDILPCPNAQDILPCLCSVDEEHNMDMNCSSVTSEDELARVFSAFFPFHDFHSLIIEGNAYLKVLRVGDLGSATFSEFHITDGVLEEVEEKALSGSVSTTTIMDFSSNEIRKFLFEHLYSFTRLDCLDLSNNNLKDIPLVYSMTLTYLDLGSNPLGHLPYIIIKDLPSVEFVLLEDTAMQDIEPGTFAGLDHLKYVVLNNNQLTNLPEGAMEVSSSVVAVSLAVNNISNVAVNAFPGLDYSILFLDNNALTELEEEVWRPVLEANNRLYLGGNPLVCGCDVAWIVLNTTFLDLISPDTTCTDGEALVNVDPSIYNDLC